MDDANMAQTADLPNWETAIAELLGELSHVQDDLLATLSAKRDVIVAGDLDALDALQQQEQQLGGRLEECHHRRNQLLQQAGQHGLPSESISQLATALPAPGRKQLSGQVQQAASQTRLLQHHSLTNWVLAQRSLLHLSQLLEILATGGNTKPTYSKEESPHARGNLVDHAA